MLFLIAHLNEQSLSDASQIALPYTTWALIEKVLMKFCKDSMLPTTLYTPHVR